MSTILQLFSFKGKKARQKRLAKKCYLNRKRISILNFCFLFFFVFELFVGLMKKKCSLIVVLSIF